MLSVADGDQQEMMLRSTYRKPRRMKGTGQVFSKSLDKRRMLHEELDALVRYTTNLWTSATAPNLPDLVDRLLA